MVKVTTDTLAYNISINAMRVSRNIADVAYFVYQDYRQLFILNLIILFIFRKVANGDANKKLPQGLRRHILRFTVYVI